MTVWAWIHIDDRLWLYRRSHVKCVRLWFGLYTAVIGEDEEEGRALYSLLGYKTWLLGTIIYSLDHRSLTFHPLNYHSLPHSLSSYVQPRTALSKMACSSGSGANTSSCNCAKFEQGGLNGTCQSCGCPVNWHSKAAGGTKKENKKYVHVPRPMRVGY